MPHGVYKPRTPKATDLFALVEDNFEELERVYDERYQPDHGYWRPVIRDVLYRYLDCADLRLGFARVRCRSCRFEFLLPYSCKRRYFCPSCHQKRVVSFAERVAGISLHFAGISVFARRRTSRETLSLCPNCARKPLCCPLNCIEAQT